MSKLTISCENEHVSFSLERHFLINIYKVYSMSMNRFISSFVALKEKLDYLAKKGIIKPRYIATQDRFTMHDITLVVEKSAYWFCLGSDEDAEATEMLIGNAQNLMQSIKETIKAAEKLRFVVNGVQLCWTKRTR